MSDALRIDLGDPGLAGINPLDLAMSKQFAEVLHQHYPGHLWAVNVESHTGMIDIRNVRLAGNWGYRLKLGAIYSASAVEADVIRAGGEILERFRVARGRFDEDRYAAAPVDFSGRLLFDKS